MVYHPKPPHPIQNELILGHGLDDGVLDFVMFIEDDVLESVDLGNGARRVRQRVIVPTHYRRSALDARHHDVGRIRPEDPDGIERRDGGKKMVKRWRKRDGRGRKEKVEGGREAPEKRKKIGRCGGRGEHVSQNKPSQ